MRRVGVLIKYFGKLRKHIAMVLRKLTILVNWHNAEILQLYYCLSVH